MKKKKLFEAMQLQANLIEYLREELNATTKLFEREQKDNANLANINAELEIDSSRVDDLKLWLANAQADNEKKRIQLAGNDAKLRELRDQNSKHKADRDHIEKIYIQKRNSLEAAIKQLQDSLATEASKWESLYQKRCKEWEARIEKAKRAAPGTGDTHVYVVKRITPGRQSLIIVCCTEDEAMIERDKLRTGKCKIHRVKTSDRLRKLIDN